MNQTESTTLKRVALLVATLSSFLTPFMFNAINVALPIIGKKFSADTVLLSWVATGYLLAAAMFLLPFGKVADIYGRKKVFTYGILTYTIASLLCAISTSIPLLIGFRVLQGLGAAMIAGTGVAILTSVSPIQERGKVLGINVAATYLGLSLGPVLGGILTQQLGWRSIFLVNVPIGLLVLALVFWKLKGEWVGAGGEKFDFVGSLVYGLALVALMYGISRLPALWGAGLILAGVLGLGLFVWWEVRVAHPVLNMDLFRNSAALTFSSLAALIHYSATSAVTFLLSLYLQHIKALSPQNAGLVLVAQPAVMAILSPFAGRLSDRIASRVLASAGMAVTVVGLLLLISLSGQTTVGFVVFSLMLLGFGFALFSSPNMNAIMSSVENRYYGIASAMVGTMRLIGQMLSMAIATLIFVIYIGKVQITPEHYPAFLTSLKTAFIIFAVLCCGGIFASLARGKAR